MQVVFARRDTTCIETRTASHSRQQRQTCGLGSDRDALLAATPGVGTAGLQLGAGNWSSKADRLRGTSNPPGSHFEAQLWVPESRTQRRPKSTRVLARRHASYNKESKRKQRSLPSPQPARERFVHSFPIAEDEADEEQRGQRDRGGRLAFSSEDSACPVPRDRRHLAVRLDRLEAL